MIKAILWDNDGVLVDTEKLFFKATHDTLARVGITLSTERFIDFSLVRGFGLCDYMKAEGLDDSDCESLRLERNRLYSNLLAQESTLFDGVSQTLEALFGTYKMGVVTSSQKEHFDIIHKSTGILKYFDFVLTSDECENTKPHPEQYLKGLKRIGVKRDECVVVEDSPRGLTAANRAGLQCLMIPHEMSMPELYEGRYMLIDTIRHVIGALDSLNRQQG
jgi:HAD superfamily hydrolase (TIGR01509 family)